ncbi:ubiquitin carboxyl-terminal hydrolase 26/29/37 [Fistulifera solaris]|uniref:Ubiquitin carboxyl-terminal hydrolase n=1 Tax=Fistulifera solaris TaxID=1519565 RepID=A0A1Z5J7Y7_FISSO|nr:ubiquitin carboxyl-terminal hydrolase 26/29/37 [Fistulifera solaris]|eukprot:GAX10105.1 ubiquitin carboxyl-terminal hydrolase 26/29/37 [Fistulifera solaris]
MNTKSSPKTYPFDRITIKEGPHRSPKDFYGEEASVVLDSKTIYINKSKWCIKGKDIGKMDVQGNDLLVISTTKGKTYNFEQFLGNEASWQEFRKKLEKVHSKKIDATKDSFSSFMKSSSKLGLGSPHRQRFASTKVVTATKSAPRRPQAVFGRARHRALPSVPWDTEEATEETSTFVFPTPSSPLKRPVDFSDDESEKQPVRKAASVKRPVDFSTDVSEKQSIQKALSDDESEKQSVRKAAWVKRPVEFSDDEEPEEQPVRKASTRKRRLVIEEDSSDDEGEIEMDQPITTPRTNRVVSPRPSTRSLSPQRPIDEIDKNQTTLSGFFKISKTKTVESDQVSSVKRELELTPRKSSVKLVSTPTRVGKSSSGSLQRTSLQQKGWLSPSSNPSRERTIERFGILSANEKQDEANPKTEKHSKSLSYGTVFGSSSGTFVFNKDADRKRFERYEAGQGTPQMPMALSSPTSKNPSPMRGLSFQKVPRSPVAKHAISDLTRAQSESDLRFNQYSGLRNLGNTCYMNSCLQMMCSLPDLIKSLRNKGGALTKSLTEVAEKLQDDRVRAIDPRAVKEAMDMTTDKFLGYEQRDAHEFLSDLIDNIHEEVQAERPKPVQANPHEASPMDDFLLTVRVCLTCASCGYSRSKEETYRHLSVDIVGNKEENADAKATVEKGLEKFFEEEIREIKCEKCEDGSHATQTMQMVHRPKSLVLHLKRFIFVEVPIVTSTSNDENKSPNSPSKLGQHVPMQYVFQKNKEQVHLSESLSLNPFLMKFPNDEPLPASSTESKHEYKLQSIIHHIGGRASSGHYLADAIRPAKSLPVDSKEDVNGGAAVAKDDAEKQSWVTFDDTSSCITSLDKILSNPNKERTAYILLYSLDES